MSRGLSFRLRLALLHVLLLFAAATARGDVSAPQKDASSSPAVGGASLVLEPVRLSGRVRRFRLIYACRDDGAVAYSDRPCGEGMTVRSLPFAPDAAGSAPDTVARAPTAATRPKPRVSERTASVDMREADNARGRCTILQTQLDTVDAHMRRGYSAREAAQLWNRWRDLKERLRNERC